MQQRAALLLIALVVTAAAQDVPGVPQTQISNGIIHARLYLPDAARGYYRGTRFDWSGVIPSLTYRGHEYFGVWFEHYDPKLHDAITGPVEEFRSSDGGLGYAEARPGGTFVKIGVGVLRKPDDQPYTFSRPYDILNPGTWRTHRSRRAVEFTHELRAESGYAYRYRKTVVLTAGKPQLILEHRLENTGSRTIDTDVYNHDFYVIDGQPTGPQFLVKFAFPARAAKDLKPLADVSGNELRYLVELQPHQIAASDIEGYGNSPGDNDIRVENRKTRAGVREVGDHPISHLYLWSIRTTVCPEAYIHLHLEPGQATMWRIVYDFYTLP